MTHADSLLLYSGGIDSVQALYARAKAGLPTRVHHVVLHNWERRAPHERAAVRSTLAWIERRFPGLVEYTESSFDYGDLKHIVQDYNVWGLMAGIILANPKMGHVTNVIRTFHRDSVKGGLGSPAGEAIERGWREAVERLTAARTEPVKFTYPQLDMTKADIMAALPRDLLGLAWYCRRPRAGRPCHECNTCAQVDAVLAGSPLEPLSGPTASSAEPAHRAPCVDGDKCGEPAHCPPESDAATPGASPTPEAEVKRPNKAKSRADWAAYAESINLGVDGLTRAEIIAAVEAGEQ